MRAVLKQGHAEVLLDGPDEALVEDGAGVVKEHLEQLEAQHAPARLHVERVRGALLLLHKAPHPPPPPSRKSPA